MFKINIGIKIHRLNLYIRDEISTKRSGDALCMYKLNLVVRRKFLITRGVLFLKHFLKIVVGSFREEIVGSFREEEVNLRWDLTVSCGGLQCITLLISNNGQDSFLVLYSNSNFLLQNVS